MKYNDTREIRKNLGIECNSDTLLRLKPMPQFSIRCGKIGGLPFNNLTTDCYSGCLKFEHACYGNCTAAMFWLEQGYNFGKRILNKWDPKTFINDLDCLPKNQKWLRQGWVSDCSFSLDGWKIINEMSNILAKRKIQLLIITKAYTYPTIDILKNLAANNVEIRVSLSALDTKKELQHRLDFLQLYRSHNGIAVPYLMSCKYKNKKLAENQSYIINYIVENNYIAGEHPLRISISNKLYSELNTDGYFHPKYKDQYWFGRILSNYRNFILPPPTHLSPCYTLKFSDIRLLENNKIKGIAKNLPTYDDLKINKINNVKELNNHAAYSIQE